MNRKMKNPKVPSNIIYLKTFYFNNKFHFFFSQIEKIMLCARTSVRNRNIKLFFIFQVTKRGDWRAVSIISARAKQTRIWADTGEIIPEAGAAAAEGFVYAETREKN